MFAYLNPHNSDFRDICAIYSHFLYQLTMQASLFEPGHPVIFTRSTGERVGATKKGAAEKRELFAVLEYMKGGQVVTHPCAPPSKNRVLHVVPVPFPQARHTAITFPCC